MGVELSHEREINPGDETISPRTLSRRTLSAAADYVRSGRVKKCVFMVGAGISTSAGIPDFRSPDTGLYANLAKLNLPSPEAIFELSYFRQNPLPFYTLAKELYPGKIRPTVTHSFIKLFCNKGLVSRVFTQNIDCLERAAGVPPNLIVEAHGSFATHSCIECKSSYPNHLMLEKVMATEIPHCLTPQCNGLVKPDIVFFGEQLPPRFFASYKDVAEADLVIIMGTSLSVHPFAALPMRARPETPRLLINKEQVGSVGYRRDDVVLLSDCDAGVRRFAQELGWLDELEKLWEETDPNRKLDKAKKKEEAYDGPKSIDEVLAQQVKSLARDVDTGLKNAVRHREWVEQQLKRDDEKRKRDEERLRLSALRATGTIDLGAKEKEDACKGKEKERDIPYAGSTTGVVAVKPSSQARETEDIEDLTKRAEQLEIGNEASLPTKTMSTTNETPLSDPVAIGDQLELQ